MSVAATPMASRKPTTSNTCLAISLPRPGEASARASSITDPPALQSARSRLRPVLTPRAGMVDRRVDDGALVLLTSRGRALAEGKV